VADTLTDEQQSLIDLITNEPMPRIACLTGGPGTGKTTTIRALVDALRAQGKSCALAAPSGKAAQRLEQATNRGASTIHRMLGLRPEVSRPVPLSSHVVVVDEASMIDVVLFSALVRSCFEGGGRVRTLLLVGDPDQLPPVGPGQPFHDLLSARTVTVPTVRLTKVQRQALDSGIVRAAYAIKDGHVPEWAPDFRLVPCTESKLVPATVWGVIKDLELDPERSQVLCPQKDRDAGVQAINKHVEAVRGGVGPLVRDKFRAGTKVIHVKNDYDLGVFNGEIGEVLEARKGPKDSKDEVLVAIAGEKKLYRGAQLNMLQPAWALTVHTSQGSEWLDVVFVAHRSHSFMLSRSLLYVAVTRARNRVVVVGDAAAVATAVRKVEDTRRRTLLQRWLGNEKKAS
jgi:exodeoxyribonuclease V alpha subunit